jgi:hypothetical protein
MDQLNRAHHPALLHFLPMDQLNRPIIYFQWINWIGPIISLAHISFQWINWIGPSFTFNGSIESGPSSRSHFLPMDQLNRAIIYFQWINWIGPIIPLTHISSKAEKRKSFSNLFWLLVCGPQQRWDSSAHKLLPKEQQ